jgi:hypothetical protein
MGAPLRPVGDPGRGDQARPPEPRRAVYAANRAGLAARRGDHPRPVRRRHLGERAFAADPWPGQPAPRGLAAGRSLPDRAVLCDVVRRRRARRGTRGAPLEARTARRGQRGCAVERVRPLGASGGRRGRRTAAVRHPRAEPVPEHARGLARRRRRLRAATGAPRASCAAGAAAVAADGAIPAPGRHARRRGSRRGGAGQLGCHLQGGDQPAQLADHQPPHRVDVAGAAYVRRQRCRRPGAPGDDSARLLLRPGHPPPLARPPDRAEVGGGRAGCGRAG